MSKWFNEARRTELSIYSSSGAKRRPGGSLKITPQRPAAPRPRNLYSIPEESEPAPKLEIEGVFEDLSALFARLRPNEWQRRRLAELARDRRSWKAAAAVAAITIVVYFGASWAAWGARQAERIGAGASALNAELGASETWQGSPAEGLGAAAASLFGAFDPDRAMFSIVEEFDGDSSPLTAVEGGPALHPATLRLDNYRFDFYTELPEKSVGWTVRARDARNYYAYRLTPAANDPDVPYRLERWAVINGQAEEPMPEPLAVPAEMIKEGTNKISVIARGGVLTTLVNGYGVDFWREDKLARGGVGFLAEEGERPAIHKMVVRGNDDEWGRILFSARRMYQELLDAAG